MRVTKSQLRRIIKEEKTKLLREGPQAERAIGLYADIAAVNAVHTALDDLVVGAYYSASEDIGEPNDPMRQAERGRDADREAHDAAQLVFVSVIQDAAREMGYPDVADALIRLTR